MGSNKLVGPNIEYIANNDSHPGAQFNSEFRSLVKTEVASPRPLAETLQNVMAVTEFLAGFGKYLVGWFGP
jgi:hypothetical protein